MWFLVKLREWGYEVLEVRSRTCELDWAHVKIDNPEIAGSSRKITPGRGFMCKVSNLGCMYVIAWLSFRATPDTNWSLY